MQHRALQYSSLQDDSNMPKDPSDDFIHHLSIAAECALTSPDKDQRDGAAQQLKFLRSYDHWHLTRRILTLCTNNYLRFIVCKSILFIVSCELGPDERAGMQLFVLTYLKSLRENNETLPQYVRQQLYLIYASALYSNWKMAIISMDNNEKGKEFDMAADMIARLQAYLPPEDMLDCMLEIITYTAAQSSKLAVFSVLVSFSRYVLPYFFEVAAHMLDVAPGKAAEVCCAALECVPSQAGTEPIITVRHTSESSIHLSRWEGWATALPIVFQYCRQSLVEYPTGQHAALFGRLLRHCSTLSCPQEGFLEARDAITMELMQLSTALLQVCQANNSLTDLLRLAADIIVNSFERHNEVVVQYFVRERGTIDAWAEATQYVLQQFAEDEDELRQALMHLFYFLGDRLLPPRPDVPGDARMDLEVSYYPARLETEPQTRITYAGPLGLEGNAHVKNLVTVVFTSYFNTVVKKAHLSEYSRELRAEAGVVLHNERTLCPLAQMLYCESIDFVPILVARLGETLEQYSTCVNARERLLRRGAMGDEADGINLINELLAKSTDLQMTVAEATTLRTVGNDRAAFQAVSLLLMRVFLSRLSVMISIFAISMVNNTAPKDDTILRTIAEFAFKLLTEDDSITDSLLQCLSLMDDDNDTDDNAQLSNSNAPEIHLGVLRSLFFFCNCVYESSDFSRSPELIDIMLGLLKFVYLHHNNEPSLMVDASVLLRRTVTCGISGASFLGSDKLMRVITAVKEDSIAALHISQLDTLPREARDSFYTAFIIFVETRYYAGYPVANVIETMLERCLQSDVLYHHTDTVLQDLIAMTRGIQQPDTFQLILHAAQDHREEIIHVVFKDPVSAALLVKWLSVLCSLAQRLLEGSNTSQTPWEISNFTLEVMCKFFTALSDSAASPHDASSKRTFNFDLDAVDASVVYDLAVIMQSMCGSHWCNLGVLMVYERNMVEEFFSGALTLLTSISVPLLMSSCHGRRDVFVAMLVALSLDGESVVNHIHIHLMRQNMWSTILHHLVKCLGYCFTSEGLQLIYLLISNDDSYRRNVPQYMSVDEYPLVEAFQEVAVLIAVSPHLDVRELSYAFSILQMCFERAQLPCSDRMENLLNVCTAYHRVRLRMILTSLRQGRTDLLEQYLPVFGQASRVGHLTAW